MNVTIDKGVIIFSIFSIPVQPAVSGFVPSSAAKRESGWLKDRALKPARKLYKYLGHIFRYSKKGSLKHTEMKLFILTTPQCRRIFPN